MARNITLQNNVVSAGKFITVGVGVSAEKQVLRNLNSSIALESQKNLIDSVKSIVNGGISPDEKKVLLGTFENIKQRQQTLASMVEAYRYDGEDWNNLLEDYNRVSAEFASVFSDMGSSTESSTLASLVSDYLNASQTMGVVLKAYMDSVDAYGLTLVPSAQVFPETGTYTVSIRITDPDGVDMASPALSKIRWHFAGTADDAALERKHYGENPLTINVSEDLPLIGDTLDFMLGLSLTLTV